MKRVLIIGLVWPEPLATAAGSRMMQLIQFFLNQGHHLTFACSATPSENSSDLSKYGINTVPILLNHESFDAFVRDLNPTLVLFDRFITEEQFGWRVAEQVPQAIRILDTEDLHSLRTVRQECVTLNVPFSDDLWLQNDKTKREIASIYRSDCSLIISIYEMQLLQETVKVDGDLLVYVPFLLDTLRQEDIHTWPSFQERTDFVFMGNGKHAPNVDAITWMKQHIWPRIRQKLPNGNLKIYGSYLPHTVLEMHNPNDGFLVLGWAKDAKAVLCNARVCLAPLRFGAGIKGKLLEAMQSGTPSVTTRIGAEGIANGLPWNGRVEDDAAAFANAAVELYSEETPWKQFQQNGVAIINQNFSGKEHSATLHEKIKQLSSHLEAHRKNNFIGTMLRHQTMAGTKYLSKWIALKNK